MLEPELLAIARVGLPGAPPPPWGGWEARLDAVLANGLAGLFSSSAAAGMVDIDADMAARLQQQLDLEATRAVLLEGELLRLAPELARLRAVVVGGPVLAHGAYSDPLLRPFAHLELLVPGRRMPEAVSVFTEHGYERSQSATGSALKGRVDKAFVLEHPGGVVIRFRRTLAAGSAGDDAVQPAAGRREVMVGTHAVPAPSWEVHLLECTLDAVGGGLVRPLALRDVAEVVHHPALDPLAAVDLAERWQIARPFGYSLRAVRDGLGVDLHPAFAALARRATEDTRATAAAAFGAERVKGRHNGVPTGRDLRTESGGAVPEGGAAPGIGPGTPASPASVPALRGVSTVVTGELATVNLPVRSTPSPARVAPRNGALHLGSGPTAGRQGAWTGARPPRQGTSRRNRAGGSGFKRNGEGGRAGDDDDDRGPPAEPPASEPRPRAGASREPPTRRGRLLAFVGGALLGATAVCTQVGIDGAGVWLVPAAALLLAGAAGRRIARRHPGEDWVGRWLLLAVGVKLAASWIRYQTLVNQFEGVGDAIDYDNFGRQFATAWLRGGVAPELESLRQHDFIRWFTGVVYYLFGINVTTGYFVYGLLAVIGSYLWYRATVDAVPQVDKRLYLGLVLFLPSMAYWPSGIGKESVMQLAIGMVALATANLLRQRLLAAFLIGAPGAYLLWYVRPHLLAMVMTAVGCAYIAGRVRAGDHGLRAFIGRPVGLLLVALLVGFAVLQGTEFLGIEDLSIDSLESRIDEQSEVVTGGGSSFDTGGSSLNPLNLPQGAVTVLLRPFPWETDSPLQLLASLEGAVLATLILVRLSSLGTALARSRSTPLLLFCWVLVILYAATFSSIGNFGIIVRQRSLVLPALFVLLAVRPTGNTTATTHRTITRSEPTRGVHAD